jgi:hypothetical protein
MRTKRVRTPLGIRIAAVAMVVIPLCWYAADRIDRRGNEHRLAAIASQIAGHKVGVHCPGPIGRALKSYDTVAGDVQSDAEGTPARETHLRAQPCEELDALAEGRRGKQLACVERSTSCGDDVQRLAWAVDTITHESFHMRGIADEAVTECYSLQTMGWTAAQLGATAEEGRAMAALNYEVAYPRIPDQYHSTDCREGGRLDLNPKDPRFP